MRDEEEDERDDDNDDDYDDRPPPFPGTVMTAGIIWIGFGALGTLGALGSMAVNGANQNAAGGGVCVGCVQGLVAFAFLFVGFQTVTGKAGDTLGNGIGSLVLGFLQIAGAVLIGVMGMAVFGAGQAAGQGQQNAGGQNLANAAAVGITVIAIIMGVFGLTLVLAGTLALAGQSAYADWRRVNAPPRRRSRRRRRRDEDDEEDRPRRRRRDDDDE